MSNKGLTDAYAVTSINALIPQRKTAAGFSCSVPPDLILSNQDGDRKRGVPVCNVEYGVDRSACPTASTNAVIGKERSGASSAGPPLLQRSHTTGRVAGIIQDQTYFREHVEPHLDQTIRYIGPVDVPGKNELFAHARALLHLNTIPERFGLVLAEANAAGVPVIAMDLGSCREVIDDGQTGFLVNNVNEAVRTLKRLGEIDRNACRQRVQECFSVETMVKAYERVYQTIFDLEATRRS